MIIVKNGIIMNVWVLKNKKKILLKNIIVEVKFIFYNLVCLKKNNVPFLILNENIWEECL